MSMVYILVPMLVPFAVIAVITFLVYPRRYRSNIFQNRKARYVAILILLAISLPILITGALANNPKWTSAGMIISYILLGLAAGLLFNQIVRLVTGPIRLFKQARRKFMNNISTYGSVGAGSYNGTGADDKVNGVPIKWKMRFYFTDASGKRRYETSIMYYRQAELDYYKDNGFAIKILGKHAVITELPFEKTKIQTAADSNKCRYCGVTLDPKATSCSSCGAKR